MGFVGSFYEYGTMYFWMVLGSFASYLILIFFLSARINRLKVYTIADIFEMRYGKGAQLVSGFINMFVGVAVGFAMLSSFASLLSSYIGIDMNLARIIGGLLFAITVTMGGLTCRRCAGNRPASGQSFGHGRPEHSPIPLLGHGAVLVLRQFCRPGGAVPED